MIQLRVWQLQYWLLGVRLVLYMVALLGRVQGVLQRFAERQLAAQRMKFEELRRQVP